jgi:Ca-activated chloride channel family protein
MTLGIRRLAATALLATLGVPLWAQEQSGAVFRSAVDLVSIAAIVRDGRGKIVSTLRRDDFEVFDAGQRRQLVDVRTESGAPASVALLVDGSGSMRVGLATEASQRISKGILGSLNPARDDAALYSFDTRLLSVQEFTHDLKTVSDRLQVVDAWGSTSLYDAIAGTSAIVAKRTDNRRAIVVLTDGADTVSAYSPSEVAAIASSVDVPVYVFVMATGTPESDKIPVEIERRSQLAGLAHTTGGDFFVTYDAASTQAAITRIVEELRHQYVLAFEASSEHGWRNVQITTKKKGLRVRTRGWYLAGDAAAE